MWTLRNTLARNLPQKQSKTEVMEANSMVDYLWGNCHVMQVPNALQQPPSCYSPSVHHLTASSSLPAAANCPAHGLPVLSRCRTS